MDKLPFEWDAPFHTAAVCVYPARVQDAVTALKAMNTDVIKVASGREKQAFYSIQCGYNL